MDSLHLKNKSYWINEDANSYSIINFIKSYVKNYPGSTKLKAHRDLNHDVDTLMQHNDDSVKSAIKSLQKKLKYAHKDKEVQEFWQCQAQLQNKTEQLGKKRKPTISSALSQSQLEAFEKAYEDMKDDMKWKLNDGAFVEDILYNYATNLDYESSAHSFIVDLEDADLKSCFTTEQWSEVSAVKSEELAPFSQKTIEYLDKISSCPDFKSMYKVIKVEDFDPYEEEEEEWVQRSLLDFHAMYRQNVIERVASRGSEKDLIIRLWRMFDTCFDSIGVETRRGEVGCLATKTNNQSSTPSTHHAQRATKPDLILTKDAIEFGSGENGRYTGSACNNKEENEKKIKNPKTMKNMMNMLVKKIKHKKHLVNELQVIGFCHYHLKAKLSIMDVPAGYVCRLRHFEELTVPQDQEMFCSLFPLLSLALIGKKIVKSTTEKLKQDSLATTYTARPASTTFSLILPPTMTNMSSRQRTE
ncbi:hypothetical protein BD560DRAFT_445418 [Blakeslea trispora]|nr:hypothetical protein BD560DRAFT_445418 [Blakeslea trispora]